MDVSRPMFAIGFKYTVKGMDSDGFLFNLLSGSILSSILFDKTSDFYENMYEKGLVDYGFGYDFDMDRCYSNASISGESENPEELLKYLKEYMSEKAAKGFSESEFMRVKRSMFGGDIRMFNFPESIGKLFSSLRHQSIHGFDYFNAYGKITAQDINRVFEKVYMQEPVMSVIKPL